MTGIAEAYIYKLAKYIKRNYNVKLVTYIVDDTYHTEKFLYSKIFYIIWIDICVKFK